MKKDKSILQIRSASREIVRQLGLLNNRFSAIGSVSQCHALVELDVNGAMNLNQLSDALNLEKSTTSRMVNQLSEQHLCNIETDKNDRRNILISLTDKGRALVKQIHKQATEQVQEALYLMSKEEKELVVNGLTLYAEALKQSAPQNEYRKRKPLKKDV